MQAGKILKWAGGAVAAIVAVFMIPLALDILIFSNRIGR